MMNFRHMQQMQEQMAEIKMRERMAEMERRGQQGNRKSSFQPPMPLLYGIIFLIVMLLTIGAIIAISMLHAW